MAYGGALVSSNSYSAMRRICGRGGSDVSYLSTGASIATTYNVVVRICAGGQGD